MKFFITSGPDYLSRQCWPLPDYSLWWAVWSRSSASLVWFRYSSWKNNLTDLLFGIWWLFETLFQSLSSRLPQRARKEMGRIDKTGKKSQNNPSPAPAACTAGTCPTIIQISRTSLHWKLHSAINRLLPLPPTLKSSEIIGCALCTDYRLFLNPNLTISVCITNKMSEY